MPLSCFKLKCILWQYCSGFTVSMFQLWSQVLNAARIVIAQFLQEFVKKLLVAVYSVVVAVFTSSKLREQRIEQTTGINQK